MRRLLFKTSLHPCTSYRFCSLAQTNLKIQEILGNNSYTNNNYNNYNNNDNSNNDENNKNINNNNNLGIYKRIKLTKSLEEIYKLLDEYELEFTTLRKIKYCDPLRYPTMYQLYPAAIKQCAVLHKEEEGWTLFNICKERDILSSYIYSIMMWFTMYFNPTRLGLNKTFDLFHEMLNETTLIPTAMIDAVLIDNCCKINEYEKAYDVLKKIKENKNSNILLTSQTLCVSITNLYIQSDNIDNGLHFLFNIYKTYKFVPNSMQCHLLLCAIANKMEINLHIQQKEKYLIYAQKLFDFAFHKNKGLSPPIMVYTPYINIFAKNGDYNTCIKLIKCMLNNDKYPNPELISCSTALSSFIYLNNYDHNHDTSIIDHDIQLQNRLIQEIINIMDKLQIKRDKMFYFILIQLSIQHNDIDKLYMYYDEINDKTEQDVATMAMYAMQYFKFQNLKSSDHVQFKDWVISEYKTYNTFSLLEKEEDIQKFTNMINNNL